MATGLVTFKPETPLIEAISTLLRYKISGAPVVNQKGELVGLLSEVDCLRAILTKTYHEEEYGGSVADCMTEKVETINFDADIVDVARLFIDKGRRRIPVVKLGKLVGQISRSDVLRAFEAYADKD